MTLPPIPSLELPPDPRVWRARLACAAPLRVERTVDVAHALLAALNQTAAHLFGSNVLPPELHVTPGAAMVHGREVHRHAFVLPEDLDLDGVLDHVSVVLSARCGAGGFTHRGLALLFACPGFWVGETDVRLEPISLGPNCPLQLDGPANGWCSVTPFVPPLERLSAQAQITGSLARLGFPEPARVERVATPMASHGRAIQARAFAPSGPAARRWTGAMVRREAQMAFWRLKFREPVEGPVLLGALSHFGMGRFAPAWDD